MARSKNRMAAALESTKLRVVDDAAIDLQSPAVAHFDAWQNPVTGFGTTSDKTTYNRFAPTALMSVEELSAIYHGEDLAARIVDIVPDEMLREGFSVDVGDPGLNAQVSEKLEALGIDDKLADGIRWGRLFGGGAILLGADDGRSAATPLAIERVEALSYLYVFDRRYLMPLTWYRDPGNPKLGQAETYMVLSPSSYTDTPMSIVHETRLVLFGGASTAARERQQNMGWDLSWLQRPSKVLGDFNIGWNAASVLLQDGNQAVFTMSGLAETLAAGGEAALLKRLKQVDFGRSVINATIVDAGTAADSGGDPAESFTRQQFPMTGIPEMLDRFMLRLAAAAQIPATILMGQSPAGMNATGQSDFQWFYDRIRAQQNLKLSPKIRRIVKLLLSTKEFAGGSKAVDKIATKFPPLWTEAPLVRAQTRKTLLEGDAIATTNGYLVAAEVATARFTGAEGFENEIQISEEGQKARKAELTHDLDDLENPPDPPEEEPPAGGGGGFGGGGFGKSKGAFGGGAPKTPFGRTDADDQPREDNGQFASADGGGGSSGGAGKGGGGSSSAPTLDHLESHHEEIAKQLDHAEAAKDRAAERVDTSRDRLDEAKGDLADAREEHDSLKDEAHTEEQARAAATKELADSEREHFESEAKARELGEAHVSQLKAAEAAARDAKDLDKANDIREERRDIEKLLKKPDRIGPILTQAREAAEKGDFKTATKLESKFDRAAAPLSANLSNNTSIAGLPEEASFGGSALGQVDHTSTAIKDAATARQAVAKAERRVAIREKALQHNERKLAEVTKQHAELVKQESAASDAISNYEDP